VIFYKLNQFHVQKFHVFLDLKVIKMSTLDKKLSAFDFETENPGNELEESDSEVYFYYN